MLIEQVRLSEPGLGLVNAFVVRPFPVRTVAPLGLGTAHPPAVDNPVLWAGRKPLEGFLRTPRAHNREFRGSHVRS